MPPTFSRFLVRRLPDGSTQKEAPRLVRETDAASWIPLVLRNEPNVVPPAEPRNGTPLVATRRKRCGGPVAHRQRIFPFCVWIARSSLWDTDPP